MLLLGYDVGSSSVKASIIDAEAGKLIASAVSPQKELEIKAPQPGWAEQNPQTWWKHIKRVTKLLLSESEAAPKQIAAIGISYQMHGLVLVDQDQNVLRPAIIWCDGRAVEIGNKAFKHLGEQFCKEHFLNSPGNFTASKLRWVRENEPEIYSRIHKFMLPGDYVAMKMTGELLTSVSGLSEAILWDYQAEGEAQDLLDYYDIDAGLVPRYVPNFSEQGQLSQKAADELGLPAGIPIAYRAGDQPNNALSLNVLDPGEAAATAGTSGVIYGITDRPLYDDFSRVNTFIHVNHELEHHRYGVLLCINGTGIQYSWLKNSLLKNNTGYTAMNEMAEKIDIGSEGIVVLPFGNGPERSLKNSDVGAHIEGINFNRHNESHIIRAAQEGIAFSLNYGLQIMKDMGLNFTKIGVGKGNMFQSPVFTEAFVNTTGIEVELYETNGAQGAAIGAGMGADIFSTRQDAFKSLKKVETREPHKDLQKKYKEAYGRWRTTLNNIVDQS